MADIYYKYTYSVGDPDIEVKKIEDWLDEDDKLNMDIVTHGVQSEFYMRSFSPDMKETFIRQVKRFLCDEMDGLDWALKLAQKRFYTFDKLVGKLDRSKGGDNNE